MKKNNILFTENGFALVTVLALSLMSLALLATAAFMANSVLHLSGVEKRYAHELDVAKGVSGYIMAQIRRGNLQCDSGGGAGACTGSNNQIVVNDTAICTPLGKSGCAGLTATLLSVNNFIDPVTPPGATFPPRYNFYSFRVTSTNFVGEQAQVEVVYKVTD